MSSNHDPPATLRVKTLKSASVREMRCCETRGVDTRRGTSKDRLTGRGRNGKTEREGRNVVETRKPKEGQIEGLEPEVGKMRDLYEEDV